MNFTNRDLIKFKCFTVVVFMILSVVSFSQQRDSIKFSIYTDTGAIKRQDNYENYIKAIHNFKTDYFYSMLIDTMKWIYSDKPESVYIFKFGYNQIKRYSSLKQALKINPDSVFYLDLRNQDLKEFPREILLFKNLKYLDLKSISRLEYVDSLPQEERIKRKEAIKKNPDLAYGIMFKSNKIAEFPDEITELKKLVWLRTDGVEICQEKYDKLKKLLPNCYVDTGIYENINDENFNLSKRHCVGRKKK